jgi:hypothetical protein
MKAKITTRKVLATIFFGATAASMVNAGKPGPFILVYTLAFLLAGFACLDSEAKHKEVGHD